KGKRVKRPAKKATTVPTTDVVIRDIPNNFVSKNKAPTKTGRGKGKELLSDATLLEESQIKKALKKKIPDEQTDKPKDTNEGTGKKPGVPNVSKDNYTNSEVESWGNSENESDDVNDEDDDNDDNGYDDNSDDNDDGGNEDDYEENDSFILKDYKEEEQDEEYMKAQVSKIMPQIEKYVTESLGAKVLVRLTNQPQTSYAVAALLSKLKLKKILTDKMETDKSINRPDIQKNLYNAFVESYNTDKDILSPYGDVVALKIGRDDQDKDEDPSAGSDRGTKRRKSRNESGHIDDQPDNEAAPKHEWFQKPNKPPTPDRAWNKSKFVDFRPPQKWISTISKECYKKKQPPCMFDELMGTPIDFSTYVMNCLKIDNLSQEILVGPAFNLLKGGSSSSKYATFTTRTKAAKYDNIEGIEDMVPTL
nr:hypothetical protein [Tanacetum cinerariifolium]